MALNGGLMRIRRAFTPNTISGKIYSTVFNEAGTAKAVCGAAIPVIGSKTCRSPRGNIFERVLRTQTFRHSGNKTTCPLEGSLLRSRNIVQRCDRPLER